MNCILVNMLPQLYGYSSKNFTRYIKIKTELVKYTLINIRLKIDN